MVARMSKDAKYMRTRSALFYPAWVADPMPDWSSEMSLLFDSLLAI